MGWAADVGSEPDSKGIVDECLRRWGKLDIYFANAGILGKHVEIKDIQMRDVQRTLRVNFIGPLLAIKYAIPVMKEAGSGSVVCTASVAAIRADVAPIECMYIPPLYTHHLHSPSTLYCIYTLSILTQHNTT